MKIFLASLMALALAACATTTPQAQTQYVQACAAYGAALTTAATLRKDGKLTAAQIAQVSLVDQQITPICTGPLPANPTAQTQQITAALTTLAIMTGAKK